MPGTPPLLDAIEAILQEAGYTLRRLGRVGMAELAEGVQLLLHPSRMELTMVVRHGRDPAEAARALEEIRGRLGSRLVERGWTEAGSETTETTWSEDGETPGVVSEVTWRRALGAEDAAAEVQWLLGRLSAPR